MSQAEAGALVEAIMSDAYQPVPAALFKLSRLRSAKRETRVKWLLGMMTRYFFSSPFRHQHFPSEAGVAFDESLFRQPEEACDRRDLVLLEADVSRPAAAVAAALAQVVGGSGGGFFGHGFRVRASLQWDWSWAGFGIRPGREGGAGFLGENP